MATDSSNSEPWVMVTLGHSGERSELRLMVAGKVAAIRYVDGDVNDPGTMIRLQNASRELEAIGRAVVEE